MIPPQGCRFNYIHPILLNTAFIHRPGGPLSSSTFEEHPRGYLRMVNWMVQYSVKAVPSSMENCTVHYMTMAAPSRHNSLGNAASNPHVQDDAVLVLTNYELARERRNKELHERVELACQSSGIILDPRVRAAFRGQSPAGAAKVLLRTGSAKRSARSVVSGEAKSPAVRVVR
jgi:hypothetical protein